MSVYLAKFRLFIRIGVSKYEVGSKNSSLITRALRDGSRRSSAHPMISPHQLDEMQESKSQALCRSFQWIRARLTGGPRCGQSEPAFLDILPHSSDVDVQFQIMCCSFAVHILRVHALVACASVTVAITRTLRVPVAILTFSCSAIF